MKIISRLVKVSIITIFAFMVLAFQPKVQAAVNSQTGQATSVQTTQVNQAKIISVNRSSDAISQDGTLKISVLSNTSANVQYRFLIYSEDLGQWKDLFNGYTSATPGNKVYEASVSNLVVGKYKISVWVKMAGTTGVIQNSLGLGNYDDYYCFDEKSIPQIDVENLASSIYQGDDVKLNVKSNIVGEVQYRVLLNKENSNDWVDITKGYLAPVSGNVSSSIDIGKISDYGNYRISVWMKRYGKDGITTNSQGLGSYDNYYCFTQYVNPFPQIKDVVLSNVKADSNPTLKVLSNISSEVQYRVFLNDSSTNTWQDVSGGYSTAVKGDSYFLTTIAKKLSIGKTYKISVWVKNAGSTGKVTNAQGLGNYDNYYCFEQVVSPTLKVTPSASNITEGDSLTINVSAPELTSAQYRVLVSKDGSNTWSDATNGYTSPVNGSNSYSISIKSLTTSGKYKISVWVKAAGTNGLITNAQGLGSYDSYYCFSEGVNPKSTPSTQYIQTQYDITLQDLVNKEMNQEPVYEANGQWMDADSDTVLKYLDPTNYINDPYGRFEFLKLTYYDTGITADDLNALLKGKGVLENEGSVFMQAAQANNINPIYLVSHALLETGNGTSNLAEGIVVNGKKVYNMFGIGAYDSAADYYGSQYAYNQGWFSVDAAIAGGAKFVSSSYVNNTYYNQNTLYKMRWNPSNPSHQYATDVKWAVNQIYNIKSLYDECPTAKFVFDIPVFK